MVTTCSVAGLQVSEVQERTRVPSQGLPQSYRAAHSSCSVKLGAPQRHLTGIFRPLPPIHTCTQPSPQRAIPEIAHSVQLTAAKHRHELKLTQTSPSLPPLSQSVSAYVGPSLSRLSTASLASADWVAGSCSRPWMKPLASLVSQGTAGRGGSGEHDKEI